MKKSVFLIGLFLTIVISCKPQNNEVKDISVEDLKVVLKNEDKVQLLDVRTPKEWEEGAIENSIKIDVTAGDFEKIALEKLDKNQPVYIYCRSGGRSKIASEILLEKGFQPYNILGGYLEWIEKNKE
ncbi:rhodanese-like domain-containing protein [Tenacibaculum caenipelagi]|uniref:Rhodanese-related sulfurtransferase n=1 Tax=Tenacibaculum caenipelagi TaxID=1325435 RepID=A0A4R6TEY2_9FLAO|nr:rhodanese-like domain-containing protein [Tenacibaculum caenipelagi]TDQ22662.1 rhodanese-related sulfurtransferase [Tenacibaculum caenipelagi]